MGFGEAPTMAIERGFNADSRGMGVWFEDTIKASLYNRWNEVRMVEGFLSGRVRTK